MAHPHDHAHPHAHAHGTPDSRGRVALAAVLTLAFMAVEVVGGLISGSLALLADAAHMLTDAGALTLAWVGYKLADRPADPHRTFGFHRVRVLAAFVNGVSLVALAAWIGWEAVARLMSPQPVTGSVLLAVAGLGLMVNVAAFAILHGGDHADLNLRGALWHVAGDLLGSVAAITAALVILTTGWTPIDPILSALVACLVAWAGWRLARESGHILIEGTPTGLDTQAMADGLRAAIPDIDTVHHVHAWSLNEARPLVTLEVDARPGACLDSLRRAVKAHLKTAFDVSHSTVEVRASAREGDQKAS